MNCHNRTVFTRYTEITEAKQIEVRRMKAEVALSIYRKIVGALRKVFNPLPQSEGVKALDQA